MQLSHSAGELNPDELERLVTIIQNPTQFKVRGLPSTAPEPS